MGKTIKTTVSGDLEVNGAVVSLDRSGSTTEVITQTGVAVASLAYSQSQTALRTITDICSDDVATPDEKTTLATMWAQIEAEKPYILARATKGGVGTSAVPYVNYLSAFEILSDYLLISPGVLLDLAVDTAVDGGVLRGHFTSYVVAREALIQAVQATTPTYADLANGVSDSASGLTTTPTAPTLTGAAHMQNVLLSWNRQDKLTGAITYIVSRSTTAEGPYSDIVEISSRSYLDQGLTLDTSGTDPVSRNYYYRVRTKCNGATGPSSNTVSVTVTPTPGGVIEAGTIRANSLEAGIINALLAVFGELAVGSGGYQAGGTGSPNTGDTRTFVDADTISIQQFDGSVWLEKCVLGKSEKSGSDVFDLNVDGKGIYTGSRGKLEACGLTYTSSDMLRLTLAGAHLNNGSRDLWVVPKNATLSVWTLIAGLGSALKWTSVAMSGDGMVQLACQEASGAGAVYLSTNGGQTWAIQSACFASGYREVSVSKNGNVLLAVDGWTSVYVSTDRGANWTSKSAGTSPYCGRVSGDGAVMYVLSVGTNDRNALKRSLNNGAFAQIGDIRGWNGPSCSYTGEHVVAGHTAGVAISHDFGATFSELFPVSTYAHCSCEMNDDGNVLVVHATRVSDSVKVVLISADSGATWRELTAFSTYTIRDVAFANAGRTIVMAAYGIGVLASDNYGATWRTIGTASQYTSIAISENCGFALACIYDGACYSSTAGIALSTSAVSNGACRYVCIDDAENISLEVATAGTYGRPTDTCFARSGAANSFIETGKNGYYFSYNKRIIAAFRKVSATQYDLIQLGDGCRERGESVSTGETWERTETGVQKCVKRGAFWPAIGLSQDSSLAWTYPVPFRTGEVPITEVVPVRANSGNQSDVGALAMNGVYRAANDVTATGVTFRCYTYRAAMNTGIIVDLLAEGRFF